MQEEREAGIAFEFGEAMGGFHAEGLSSFSHVEDHGAGELELLAEFEPGPSARAPEFFESFRDVHKMLKITVDTLRTMFINCSHVTRNLEKTQAKSGSG